MSRSVPCPTCGSDVVPCPTCAASAKARSRARATLLVVLLAPALLCLITAGAAHLVVDRSGTVDVDASAPYARLRLVSLTCEQANDGLLDFFEEPSIDVAGRTVWEGADFRTGTVADLSSIDCVIQGTTLLEMLEEDTVNDDPLGAVALEPAPGDGQRVFQDREGTTVFTLAWRAEPVGPEERCAVARLRTLRRARTADPGFSYVEAVTLLVDGRPARARVTPRLWPTPLALAVPFEGACTLQVQVDVTRSGEGGGAFVSHLSGVETLDARDEAGVRSLVFRIGPPHEAEYVIRCDVVR